MNRLICERRGVIAAAKSAIPIHVWFAAVLAFNSVVGAQTVKRLDSRDAAKCGSCGVEVRRIASLEHDDLLIPNFVSVAGRVGSRFYVAPLGPKIYVFDAGGRFVRILGRYGQGPGEFQFIRTLAVSPADTLYAFDQLRRFAVFGVNGAHVRTHLLPYVPSSSVAFADGRFAISAPGKGRSDAGLPIHLRNVDGEAVRSFGAEHAVLDPREPDNLNRFITAGNDGTVWSAFTDRYRVEQWDTLGALRQVIIRESGWFDIRSPRRHPTARDGTTLRYRLTEPPASSIRGIDVDNEGHLWVLIAIADKNWKSNDIWLGEGESLTPSKLDAMFDSLLEELDPVTGRVLSSTVLPTYFSQFTGRSTVASLRETDNGGRAVDVWEIRKPSRQRKPLLRLAAIALFVSASAPPATSSSAPDDTPSATAETPRLNCWLCVYSSGPPELHAFVLESSALCDTPEERAQNNCRACGGESECYDDLQGGDCHQECIFSEEEIAIIDTYRVGNMEKLLTQFESAVLEGGAGRVELNAERRAIQILNCQDDVGINLPLTQTQFEQFAHLLH